LSRPLGSGLMAQPRRTSPAAGLGLCLGAPLAAVGATWVDDERRWRTRTATRPGGRTHPRWAHFEIVRSWTGHRDVTGLRVGGRAEAHHGMFHVERCSETHAVARTITHAGRSERLVDEHQVPAQPRCNWPWGLARPRGPAELPPARASRGRFYLLLQCAQTAPTTARRRNQEVQQMPRLRRSKTDWWRNR
jgi:hypothetical protein